MNRIVILAAGAALLAGSGAPAAAKSSYDGLWSVLVVTESGTCDRGYRYGLRIRDGAVRYEGDAAITISGRVGANGAVRVAIRRGSQGANGSGRLSANGGGGRWTAAGGGSKCSGSWSAERRG